jgi:hypothetical protein
MKNDTAYSLLLLALVTAQFIAGLLALVEITLGHYVSACAYTIAVVASLLTRKLCSDMTR